MGEGESARLALSYTRRERRGGGSFNKLKNLIRQLREVGSLGKTLVVFFFLPLSLSVSLLDVFLFFFWPVPARLRAFDGKNTLKKQRKYASS